VSHIPTLALNTFREAIRDRILSAVLVFGGIMVVSSVILAPLSLGEEHRIIRDLGLASITLFTVLTIVMVGTGMVYREIEHRTIHTILTHPVNRAEFILGKYLGLYSGIFLSIVILATVYLLVVAVFAGGWDPSLFVALSLTAAEAGIVTAIAIFFSSVASPLLSAVFTFLVFVAGHLAGDLKELAGQAGDTAVAKVVEVLYVALPSLHQFDVRNNVLSGAPIDPQQVIHCHVYALLYSAAVIVVTIVAFSRRDFE
jgi:ABC-type transport system involved in multi-copper enzyme maturation permease subunit